MKDLLWLLWLCALPMDNVWGAAVQVEYETLFNGRPQPDEGLLVLTCEGPRARLDELPAGEPLPGGPRETIWLDHEAGLVVRQLATREGLCERRTNFADLPRLMDTEERATLLGRACRKATTEINSNQIEVWYTTDGAERGGPGGTLLVPGGLVLRVVQNGQYETRARSLKPVKKAGPLAPAAGATPVDGVEYRARQSRAWTRTVEIFRDQAVCFAPDQVDTLAEQEALRHAGDADSSRVLRFAAGTLVLRRLTLPAMRPATAYLELVERSAGDAYDRTGSVFLLDGRRGRSLLDALARGVDELPAMTGRDGRRYPGMAMTEDYLPPLELMRFITPFGVGHFNERIPSGEQAWADSALYRVDVSDLLPALEGPVWLGVFVGNYDKGGHRVDVRLRLHPDAPVVTPAPERDAFCLPLFNTTNVLEMAGQEYGRMFGQDSLRVEFTAPEGATGLRLRYVSTGHGGWGGGDEFNPKPNTLLLDGRPLAVVTPWRSDCASLRALNPASGVFWNGVASSDLSRSGWCPGAAAQPVWIDLPDLAPGPHLLQVAIPQGAEEGNAFSAWNVSAVLTGQLPAGATIR